MMTAVEGYYNGTSIVTDEKVPLRAGQKVIITILENPAADAMRKFQAQMKGEAENAGFKSEDDIDNWITLSRRKEND